ncbi:hypothetical protein ACSBR2_032223 [Camellia fascicularis]
MGVDCQSCHVFTNPHTLMMSQSSGFLRIMKRIIYDNMMKIQEEQCSKPGVVPITPEGLSVKVLKRRSGYVKGLGFRPSFSIRTTSASTGSDYSQKEETTTQKHKIQAQKEEIQSQNNVIEKMNESSKEHLEMTSSIMEFLKKQGFKGQFRGGGIL